MKNTCKDYDLNCSKHCSPQRLQPVTCVESYHRGEACNATCIIEGSYPTSCRISICQSIYINKSKSYFSMSPRRESNPDRKFRKLLFFPLNYRVSAEPFRGLPTGTRSNEAYFSTSHALQYTLAHCVSFFLTERIFPLSIRWFSLDRPPTIEAASLRPKVLSFILTIIAVSLSIVEILIGYVLSCYLDIAGIVPQLCTDGKHGAFAYTFVYVCGIIVVL